MTNIIQGTEKCTKLDPRVKLAVKTEEEFDQVDAGSKFQRDSFTRWSLMTRMCPIVYETEPRKMTCLRADKSINEEINPLIQWNELCWNSSQPTIIRKTIQCQLLADCILVSISGG